MAKGRKKVAYVVRIGREPGLYFSWQDCEKQVHRFPGALFEGYLSRHEAESAWATWEQKSALSTALAPISDNANCRSNPITAPLAPITQAPSLKRSGSFIHPTDDDDDDDESPLSPSRPCFFVDLTGSGSGLEEPRTKRYRSEEWESTGHGDSIPVPLEEAFEEEEKIQLTPAQEAVVQLAVGGHNIFLTGAAGSGKTATLRGILQRIKKRVQVIAPTAIAALAVGGKTTYSFAGWKPDSFQQSLESLLRGIPGRVHKEMKKIDVLIIEEISMVENQFLERLNLLMIYVLNPSGSQDSPSSQEPFGGVQLIFLGDFHQLPPVKPFEFCLNCGDPMAKQNFEPVCQKPGCPHRGISFHLGDKWAFRAPVWKKLRLKHVKLEQIHRQKDVRFQEVLNKIRNGILLTDSEWNALTAKKETSFAVKLMSRRKDVTACNERFLESINGETRSWNAIDSCQKLHRTDKDADYAVEISRKAAEHMETLKDHRFPTILTLKVGAKVVLLANINLKGGLVNGSQGEIVKFVDTENWPPVGAEGNGDPRLAKQEMIREFQTARGFICPVVRFQNGKIVTIRPVPQDSLRGSATEKYLVSRTQIPLTLAWALSIHKSQGMTLNQVEVSSNAMFESGQLYVGLSRATKLEGLTVTGYSREQLEMDEDVLEFYENAPWEDLGLSKVSQSRTDVNELGTVGDLVVIE